MKEKEQQSTDKRHRSLESPIWQVFDHEIGPYMVIRAGHKPLEWQAEDISLETLREDVENQLTILIAGEEFLRRNFALKYIFRDPVYGDVVRHLGEIENYRDKGKERFMAELEEKIQRLFPK